MTRNSACGDCSTCGGCESKILNLELNNDIAAEVGDFVEISYDPKSMLLNTLFLYIFPLIMLVIGVYIGYKMNIGISESNRDLFSFAIGLVFLAISYLLVHLIDKKLDKNKFIKLKKINSIFDSGDLNGTFTQF